MLWNVKNALNRDVEREHLNKILAEIRGAVDENKLAIAQVAEDQTDVFAAVGSMVGGNVEEGINVTYNPTLKKLNFVTNDFTITLTGDVTGQGRVESLGSVTINTSLANGFVQEAPNDGSAYWRRAMAWDQVPYVVESLADIVPPGFAVINDDYEWIMREMEGPMSVLVTYGDGLAGNPSFELDGDVLAPGLGYTYATSLIDGAKGWYRPALFESTGVLSGGTLSINAGDNTTFDVAQTVVGSTDYDTSPVNPVRSVAVYGPTVANAVPSLAVIATYVGIQMPGGTLVMQSSPFTATQTRTIAPLGAVISNGVNLIAVNNLPGIMRAGINQVQDLMAAIGPMNLSGNVISANGAGLDINKSAGVIFKQGSNFTNDPDNPHGLSLAALSPASFSYRLSDGTQFAATTSIDPDNYESPLGTLTAIPAANRYTIQRVYVFSSNLVRVQYGQVVYNTMGEAEAALATEAFVTETNIAENGLLLAFLIVKDGTTDLTVAGDAKFIPASKFGGPVGSGGTSITNTDALPEGLVNLYFTDARARAAVLATTIVNGDTTHAPDGNAVFDALALKQPASFLKDKKMAFMGDSIVHLNTFPTLVGDMTGAITANYGLFGFRWAETNPAGAYDDLVMYHVADAVATNNFAAQITAADDLFIDSGGTIDLRGQVALMDAEDWATVDYLVIMYGANDVGSNIPIGSATSTAATELKGAINHTITTIQAARPNLQIILVTPNYLSGYETTKNTTGAYNYNYADAILERGAAHKVPVMDMLRSSGINTDNYLTYLPDGVHPNAAGNIRIADKLAGHLMTGKTDAVGPLAPAIFAQSRIWSR